MYISITLPPAAPAVPQMCVCVCDDSGIPDRGALGRVGRGGPRGGSDTKIGRARAYRQ